MEKTFDYEKDIKELIEKLDFVEGTDEDKERFLAAFFRSLIFC